MTKQNSLPTRALITIGVMFAVSFVFIAFSPAAYAAVGASDSIKWSKLLIGLFGGLAFFLYGMEMMSEGMRVSAGDRMRAILGALTKNRVIGLVVGAFVTMVIQSSSATTVMLVSFVNAGLMDFAQSLGVILGADIGTTVTAQLVAFKLTTYALLMIALGFIIRMMAKRDNVKHMAEVLLGFGILFFGMKLMSDSMKPLRSYSPFLNMMSGLESPVFGIFIGTLFTALVQSSSATTGIVIVLAQQNLVSLEAGIPLIMGANVGTCITAALASIGASRDAKRVAIAHTVFKLAGVMLFVFWIPTFATGIKWLALQFDSGTARQIANAHTVFNVTLAFAFLPFTGLFDWLVHKVLPKRTEETGTIPVTWHLDQTRIAAPSAAIQLARAEIARMAKILGRMLSAIILPLTEDTKGKQDEVFSNLSLVEGIQMREEKVDFLDEKISDYLVQVGRQKLSEQEMSQVFNLLSITKDMESIGDIIDKTMIPQVSKKQALKSDFSEEGKQELVTFHKKVCKQIWRLEEAFAKLDSDRAKRVLEQAETYSAMEEDFRRRHLERIRKDVEESTATHEVHMEVMDLLRRINTYAEGIARAMDKMEDPKKLDGADAPK